MNRNTGFIGWFLDPKRRGPLLIAPAIIVLLLVNIVPLMWSLGLSFFKFRANQMKPPSFSWFYNYEKMLTKENIWESLQTTGIVVASSVFIQMILGFALAMLFAKKFPLRRIILMLVLTPMMLSYVAVGIFFKLFYEPEFGLLSQFIQIFTGEMYVLLATPAGALLGVIVADAWQWTPFVMLLSLAGLVSVPKYLYEAAEIDRISWWRQFTTITFPYVRSLLLLAVLFRTIETFKIFDLVYILTNGGPGTATETIAVLVYRMAFQYFRTSNSTALGYILIFIVIVLTSLYLYVIKKRESAEI
jgi:multiple sugar transport system permease protein|tara:strand:+ start:1552 stop:2457 length:906 start_codon:yes stop_codon:yes gene_type:complete